MNPFSTVILSLRLHDVSPNTNVTSDAGMTVEMKTFYDKNLLKNAFPKLVHNQFGQKRPIPKGGGKIIEFRKFTPLAKALTPLSEGVTPNGQKLSATSITATVLQYGAYVTYSDVLQMTTIDPVLVEGTKMLGHQAGETIDTLTREVLNGGDTVQHHDGTAASRGALAAFNSTWANNDYFNCEVIRRAMLTLRNNKASPIEGGDFVCIIHPELEYCLKKDSEWQDYQKGWSAADKIFDGEIGRFDGCRFVVSTEAKIFAAPSLIAASKTLTYVSIGDTTSKVITVAEKISEAEATAMTGRSISLAGVRYDIDAVAHGGAGVATITVDTRPATLPSTEAEKVIYPADMGATETLMPLGGADVATALFLGADAYGVTDIEGLGLTTVVKPLGSGEDPLNQRSTAGWKATHIARRLAELWMVRAECTIPHVLGAN